MMQSPKSEAQPQNAEEKAQQAGEALKNNVAHVNGSGAAHEAQEQAHPSENADHKNGAEHSASSASSSAPSAGRKGKSGMDESAVIRAYKRWAPVYDFTFGQIAEAGRRHAVKIINRRKGSVLEVGVGTGLSLPCYDEHLSITGIDLSREMLDKARGRVKTKKLAHIKDLHEMDAGHLEFEDASFDTVVAMYVLTVVPDPERVMQELQRVCAPGGEVILVNHFSQEEGVRGWIERKMAPLAATLGWRPIFPLERVMGCKGLRLAERRSLRPFGLFTMLRFVKQEEIAADSKIESESSPGIAPSSSMEPAKA